MVSTLSRKKVDTAMTFLSFMNWTRLVDKPTCVSDRTRYQANQLDTFYPERFSSVLVLGTSNQSLTNVKDNAKSKASPDVIFHRMIFRYAKVDWDGLKSYIV